MTDTAERPTQPDHDAIVAKMTGGLVPDVDSTFAGSELLRPDGRPIRAFRDELRKIPNAINAVTVAIAFAAPIVAVAGVVAIDHWLAVVVAIPLMANLQLRWYILFHEASHRLLFSNRRLNDLIGINLMGWLPFGTGTHHYRRGHANHHRDEFGPNEPDFLLYSFYPIARSSMRRKLRRDATGVSAWRIIKPRFTGLVKPKYLVLSLRFFCGQAIVFAAFVAGGAPWMYLWLWVVPYVTIYQVVNRLRSIAEHGGMTRSPDRRETTHHVRQTLVARALMAPHFVGYHLAHHVDSGVPMRNLPKLQAALDADGYAGESITWPSYTALWKSMVTENREPAATS